MAFTSFHFFIFFPVVVLIYYLMPFKQRWWILLLASVFFYSLFSWKYLLFLAGISIINYYIGLQIIDKKGQIRRGLYISGILFNILILCFFKYFNYLEIDFVNLAGFLHLHYPVYLLNIIFPLGLSYFIFTSLSYLVDLKRQVMLPEKHPGIFISYFLFFPKIIQGPIERAGRVLPQFHEKRNPDPEGIKGGLILMAWGFFKKVVIADNLAIIVSAVYSGHGNSSGPVTAFGIILFGFQLYADFSGYTDIALGSARILGFDLTQNFRRPYLAKSVRDFWTRWHISLSSWCSDYIFLPILTYSYPLKKKLKKTKYLRKLSAEKIMYVIAAFITFFIIGIWHGVGWNYIMVGFLFGFYVSFDMLTKNLWKKINMKAGITKFPLLFTNIQIFTTFFLVCIVWIFFRTDTMASAYLLIKDLLSGWSFHALYKDYLSFSKMGMNWVQIIAGIAATGLLIIWDMISEKEDMFVKIGKSPVWVRWAFYYLIVLSIILFSAPENKLFIYLQF